MATPKQPSGFVARKLPDGRYSTPYPNLVTPVPFPEWAFELRCWLDRIDTGYDPYYHLQRACKLLWPDNVWHPWREERFRAFCDDSYATKVGSMTVRSFCWVGSGAGGKAQPLDAIVWTPTGPARMENLRIGDLVCTPDGGSSRISGIYPQGQQDIYRVTLNDGSSVRCTLDHLWKITDRGRERVVDTAYLLKNFRRISAGRERTELATPFTKPVEFAPKPVDLHPYLMGVLIGNGCLGGRCGKAPLNVSIADAEVVDRVSKIISRDGYQLVQRTSYTWDYGISRLKRGGHSRYIDALRKYQLWATTSERKFIPDDYLINSVESRFELLRGLMDTDGTVSKNGGATYDTTSERLAWNVRQLVQSLGGTCRITKKPAFFTYNGVRKQGKDSYRCRIIFDNGVRFFHLSRKQARIRHRRANGKSRIIVNVEKHGHEYAQCIKVDHPGHLYLTDDFIVTHNTFDTGLLALVYFLAAPHDSSVTLTSTTKDAIRQRVWPVVQSLYYQLHETCFTPPNEPFHMLNSKTMLQWKKGDDKHSIFALAVKDGETAKAVDNLKGRHTPRMMLIVDEAAGTPEAVYENIPNMFKGVRELCLFFLSNGPTTKMDAFSTICEPLGGWNTVGPSDKYWRTKGVPKYQIPESLVLHFSGADSPNVKAQKTIYPFLYSYENWLKVKDDPEIQRTAMYWSQDLGFWPPEEFALTVMTVSLIEAKGAKETVKFRSRRIPVGSMDPGFGGDDCVLLLGAIGDTEDGEVLQIEKRIVIPILVDAKDDRGRPMDAEHQIAQRVKRECESHGILPENFAIEATGTGRGAASVLANEWGEVVRVESGGSASGLPVSPDDPRPSHHLYDRRITELWFSIRQFVTYGQLKGLYEEAIKQLCSRLYSMPNKKIILEKKDDYKARMGGKSPNDGDALAMLVELARRRGLEKREAPIAKQDHSWRKFAKEVNDVYESPSIYDGEKENVQQEIYA